MATTKLPLTQVATAFELIKPELGTANLERLTLLQALCQQTPETNQLQIATVLKHLYPNNTATQASTNLRRFRLAFNEAATEAGVKLEWKVDQDRKRSQERPCWFEGDKLHTRIARRHSQQQAYTGDEQLETPTGVPLNPGNQAYDSNRKAINVLDDLRDWLNDENSEAFYALLGDLGMGKTTTLRTLIQELLRDETAPTPLYFDLRDLHYQSTDTTLESILRDLLDHSWGVRAGELSPQDIIDLVQKEGAIAIFDGLDAVLVNLPPQQGQQFTRLLWQILPPRDQKKPETRGRMILSCRTHYFPSVHEQNNMFSGRSREQIKSKNYRGTLLLPFNEVQIKNYLRNNFPQNDADQSWQLMQGIYNLQDLATHPYTLSIIADQLQALEQKQLRGEVINTTDLYEVIINHWLNRDEGKHQLSRYHKRWLMGMLACDLWQSGQRTWPCQRLEQWLVDCLHQHPEIIRHYQFDNNDVAATKTLIALFKQDLCTATFIVRFNDDEFGFAHSSMLEYFLACQLYNLCASETALALQPNRESRAFMTQIARRQKERKMDKYSLGTNNAD